MWSTLYIKRLHPPKNSKSVVIWCLDPALVNIKVMRVRSVRSITFCDPNILKSQIWQCLELWIVKHLLNDRVPEGVFSTLMTLFNNAYKKSTPWSIYLTWFTSPASKNLFPSSVRREDFRLDLPIKNLSLTHSLTVYILEQEALSFCCPVCWSSLN